MSKGVRNYVIWSIMIVLAFVGFAGSVMRGIGVIESLAHDPVPELSRFDDLSTVFLSSVVGVTPGSELFRDVSDQNRRFLRKFNLYPVTTLLHVTPAALLMLLLPLQFSRRIRERRIGWHRWSGRLLVALAIPIGLSGLFFGLRLPFSGFTEASAIAFFGALFLLSAVRGFVAIRRGDLVRHREWMIRFSGVALGVATVRIVGAVIAIVTVTGPEAWFGLSLWIGFASTSVAAEYAIRLRRREAREDASVPVSQPRVSPVAPA